MKIKEVFTEGFWAGVASGLTGMDYINKGSNFETSVDQLSDDDFKKVFAMSKQQFSNLDRKIQGKLLRQAAEKLNIGKTVAEPTVDQEPTQQSTVQKPEYKTTVSTRPGYTTAVAFRTNAGDVQFWFDGTDWRQYQGNNWPQNLEVSQKVADDKTLNLIAKKVASKDTLEIPAPLKNVKK
jgi:hypothetical protein